MTTVNRDPRELYRFGNKVVTVDDDLTEFGFTAAQDATVKELAKQATTFVTLLASAAAEAGLRSARGPKTVLFYDRSDRLNSVRINRAGRVINKVTF